MFITVHSIHSGSSRTTHMNICMTYKLITLSKVKGEKNHFANSSSEDWLVNLETYAIAILLGNMAELF